ncbi:MAG: hypothetical protein RIS17_202 [Pseudomonadota bacterium]|jgi:flagellar protein FlbT
MALRIILKDGEQMIINGAVIRAQGRIALDVESEAAILRGREVMSPDDATTPARRLYFAAMLAYVDLAARDGHQARALDLVADLVAALSNPEAVARAIAVAQKLAAGQHYKALADCAWLIGYEDQRLGRSNAEPEAA